MPAQGRWVPAGVRGGVKRTPLTRKAKLKPGKATMPRARLKRTPFRAKKAKDAEEASAFSRAVLDRDRKCRRCLWRKATEAHHVVPRSRAAGHPLKHDARAGIGLCWACHFHVHSTHDTEWLKGRKYLDTL